MRIETLLRICEALHVTPNDIITTDNPMLDMQQEELFERMNNSSQKDREAGAYIIRWTSVLSNRFDSSAFKKEHSELYKQFTKQVASKRFSIA